MPFLTRAILALLVIVLPSSASAQSRMVANPGNVAGAGDGPTRLLRDPSLSATHIAFAYANDIWIAPREGGDARRITSFQGQEVHPRYSPDGQWLAFSAQYAGNTDVYVVPAEGGEPRRLTWHPGGDVVQGWTPDGARIVFASGRTNAPSGVKFWTVGLNADFPRQLPMPRAFEGSFSPDGRRFAYRMPSSWDEERRGYRGGQNKPIWILDMDDYGLEEIRPWDGSKETQPVWIGQTVYFLSDRDWAANVWSYDTRTKELKQVTRFRDFDVKALETDGRTLVIEQAGWLHLVDPANGEAERVDIRVRGDFPWLMPRWEDISNRLTNAQLSATGKRAVFEARGDIFTVPTDENADWRNLTGTPGIAERTPAWSPDGKWVSWFSDASGEYRLVIAPQDGMGTPREITIPDPKFYYTPAWSPDSKKIVFTDTDLRIWLVDIESGNATHVDTDQWMVPSRTVDPVWSPDSRWLAYAKRLDNLLHAVFVYNVENRTTHQITDGFADAYSPAWDASGKYLYFFAGTDMGLATGWLDMTSYDRNATRGIYLTLLQDTLRSPFLPVKGDEAVSDTARADSTRTDSTRARSSRSREVRVDIDFDNIERRILALPVPERDYRSLQAGTEGQVFYIQPGSGGGGGGRGGGGGSTLQRFSMSDREAQPFMSGVASYSLSPDRKKLLYRAGSNWGVVDSDRGPPSANAGRIDVADLRMRVDPRAEFRQMFSEGWRFQRDYLYVENMHGVDYARTKAQYEPMLEHVAHRADFNYLLDWMGGEVAVGHSYVRGGDNPDVPDAAPVGLPGADFEITNGRYHITKIYRGESWNPGLRAPLAEPGIDINEGDYLLRVNGTEIRGQDNLYRLFEGTGNRQTVIRVGPNADGTNARDVTVVPLTNDGNLRDREWIENNRKRVDELSNGRLAYVWLPNTGRGGYGNFNRYYYAQQDREGAIIDERFNGGGSAADYIVEMMAREPHGYFNNPVGERKPFTSPAAGIWGPKVMIINEMAGSGGDLMPYMFRFYEVGPLVGTRTWGGLVGTWDTPQLLDGGSMIAPRGGFFTLEGEWAVENEGVAPDIEVEETPKDVLAGRDPQLERAVQEALRLLDSGERFVRKAEPPPPVLSRRPGGGD